MKRLSLILTLLLPALAYGQLQVSFTSSTKSFPLVSGESSVTILYDDAEDPLIHRSAGFLSSDIERVSGNAGKLSTSAEELSGAVVIMGTINNSKYIKQLVSQKKIKVDEIKGDWERYIVQTVKNPMPGLSQALVIVGSDRRGVAYGVFSISEKMGVSPWHYWADVPAAQHQEVYVKEGRFVSKEPSVKYRGIFINDEAPALRSWAQEQFGGFNHQFYEKVFELILRNKGNYLWPAMWRPSAFADDDPKNAPLADEYGIVISTSHHEPMMRAHDEWSRFEGGEWNYETNKEKLQEFWKGGIERMGDYESVVTLGMRGDGDEAMTEDTAVGLLKEIIEDQRAILADVTGKPAEETPQVWAIYKEVQDYYDKGLRVDDDITVLFCDDNWGNIRILPKKEDLDHSGGYGIYYHFDFVGGPVSYRWLNVTQIERVWEQMNLAYDWGVKDLWIVNVGDIKPMELPISFFLDFAYDTEGIRASDLPAYYTNWAAQQFGDKYANEIGDILSLYTKYNARRTPEMLKPDTYSISNYREADRIVSEYEALVAKSESIYNQLPEEYKAAFYQLVYSPVLLCSNINKMYVAAGKNEIYALQGRASANYYADKTKEYFFKDAELTDYFHTELADGKWNHIMAQTHIGYRSWNNPRFNQMPEVSYIQTGNEPSLGYVVEHGETNRWNRTGLFSRSFSTFDPYNNQEYYLEVFNSGKGKLNYTVTPKQDWIKVSKTSGSTELEEQVMVSVDWSKAPKGKASGEIELSAGERPFRITVPIQNLEIEVAGFVENNGVVSIDASKFTTSNNTKDIEWVVVPNMGRTSSSLTVQPADAPRQEPGKKTPYVEYEFTLLDSAEVDVHTYLSPTLNYKKNEGLKYAIAIDNGAPQIINMHEGEETPDWEYPDWWNDSVTDHIKTKTSEHGKLDAGTHTLKVWMVDPGVVFQKFVIDGGGLKESYLGPPTSTVVKND